MFKRPSRDEVILAVLMFAGYIVYAIVVDSLLTYIGLSFPDSGVNFAVNVEMIVSLVFSMMGEELVKFIPMMFFMRVVFKYTSNRKLAIFISSLLVLIGFGLFHYEPSVTLASVIALQGFGSVFEIYGYSKTKNIFVPYSLLP